MADDFVPISRSAPKGSELLQTVEGLRSVLDRLRKIRTQAEHMWDTGVHTTLEAQFGLPAGAGPNFLNLLGAVLADIEDGPVPELLARFG